MKYSRCETLFGDNFEQLKDTKIIILGVGGVGSFALDCLYRTGITNITIVDYDTFEESNQNRQIGSEALGEHKVYALEKRYPGITAINKKIDLEWVKEFDLSSYDLILDAIDDIRPKIEIVKKYYKKLISTTGSAKRIDPTQIEYKSIWDTHNDSFAKKMKYELKKDHFNKKFKVVTSSEGPKCKELGSFVGVTGAFGLTMCSVAIQKILSKTTN